MVIGIILASGFSRRMGRDKLLLEVDGNKIIERVIKASIRSNLDKVILIYRTKEVGDIGEKYGIEAIKNEHADLGQSQGMKLGIKAAGNVESYMFIVGDQPFLTSQLINKLIKEYKKTELAIVVPYYNGSRGMPMIISSIYKNQLLQVIGDRGGRDIVKNHPSQVKKIYIESERLGIDIDTQEDFENIDRKD